MSRARYTVDGFQGSVCLKDWFQDPISGRQVRCMMGKVTIMEAKEMVGFDTGDKEANWIARVEGPTQSYNSPGCQIRCIIDHRNVLEPSHAAADALVVP